MLLSDRDIRREMQDGGLVIEPLEDIQVQPASVDLRLGGSLRKLGKDPFLITRNGYPLRPGKFILGDTLERLEIPAHLAAQFAGRSSLGRIGLQTHCTAGFVDPGFRGTLTVELSNLSNQVITLHAGQPVGQLCVFRLSGLAERPYGHPALGSHYLDQSGPTASAQVSVRGHATARSKLTPEPDPASLSLAQERKPKPKTKHEADGNDPQGKPSQQSRRRVAPSRSPPCTSQISLYVHSFGDCGFKSRRVGGPFARS